MSYQSLARTWRPRNFSELVGQTHVRTALENALSQGRLHPALLFSGTRGVGKTTLARIIASCLNCETGITATPCGACSACQEIEQGRFVDLIEVDAASRTKVDDTRELLENVPYAPARGRCKVYLIDEVHMLSKSSFNALLKTLEEPPGHVQFLFATTDPQKLPITILSRCLQFHLQRIAPDDIAGRMRFILGQEKIEFDDDGLRRLARAADGSLRDGLSLLDQAIAFGAGQVQGAAVAQMLGSIERRDLLSLVAAIADQDAASAWQAIDAIEAQGLDFIEVLDEMCRLWQRLAVGQRLPEVWDELEQTDLAPLAERFSAEDLQVFYQIALNARRDIDWAPDPRCGFEMTVLRTLAFLPESMAGSPAPGRGSLPPARAAAAPGAAPASVAHPVAAPAVTADAAAPALQPGEAAWAEILDRLDLSGVSALVAESGQIAAQSEEELELAIGPDCSALCTPIVEKRLREALQTLFGKDFRLRLSVQQAESESDQAIPGRTPEEQFLAQPGVVRMMKLFDAKMQPGTLRVGGEAGETQSIN